MLVTPRTYHLSQTPDKGLSLAPRNQPVFHTLGGWTVTPADQRRAAEMLLIHQVGSVHVGEVARYTFAYTPSADRLLPTPTELYVKVRNTSATPLRAAYLHGPYTFHASCYPASFDPNSKFEDHEREGTPQFEPNLKAGGSWNAVIPVPERARTAQTFHPQRHPAKPASRPSISWIVEITSQVIFSATAVVHFELLVGRDQRSTELGAGGTLDLAAPGHLHELCKREKDPNSTQRGGKERTGVYSDSIKLRVDDTSSLWSTPRFPSYDDSDDIRAFEQRQSTKPHSPQQESSSAAESSSAQADERKPRPKRKKVHFVVLTHGLHSNLGADLLYLKESIDGAAKQARDRARQHRKEKKNRDANMQGDQASGEGENEDEDDDDDDELVVVRGFPGNAVRTERGIQYLGKRLAKYVLLVTYPDQPYLPMKDSRGKSWSRAFGFQKGEGSSSVNASHPGSTIHYQGSTHQDYAYKITSISFIGHSLGGLVQTYAIAYIQKHSPEFFELIKPINFVALSTPFLGLSNENPMYIRFALDFGLVGRSGQDLGLSWSAPSKVRSGWGAMIGGLGNDAQRAQREPDPGSKPLLRILPAGPAHQVLKKFRNRTVYSNVVNDGIVPLRTSCLLFLDWRGLDRVEKARRDIGLVGTMAEWGWAELTGANSRAPRNATDQVKDERQDESGSDVPQPSGIRSPLNSSQQLTALSRQDPPAEESASTETETEMSKSKPTTPTTDPSTSTSNALNSFLSIFRPKGAGGKSTKMIKRSQTLHTSESDPALASQSDNPDLHPSARTWGRTRGDSLYNEEGLRAPPKTTIFESAGDVLNPPLPTSEFLVDPASRPRTIFHDRIYHPDDIPIPVPAKQRSLFSSSSANVSTNTNTDNLAPESANTKLPESDSARETSQPPGGSGMKVEEKIARAYHRDLSWRKVLVSLEPDAHNNIIVRRKFANAYGWPVVKHLVDTHFGYTQAAKEPDSTEPETERARPHNQPAGEHGTEVVGQEAAPNSNSNTPNAGTGTVTPSTPHAERPEGTDEVPEIMFSSQRSLSRVTSARSGGGSSAAGEEDIHKSTGSLGKTSSPRSKLSRQDSARWTDRYFEEDGEDDEEDYARFHEEARRAMPVPSVETPKLDTDSSRVIAETAPGSTVPGNVLGGELISSPNPLGKDGKQSNPESSEASTADKKDPPVKEA